MKKKQTKTKELLKAKKSATQGREVTLEELESLCYEFSRRGRGCTLDSTGGSDDILF